MNKLKPYLRIPISEFIKEEMEIRNWTEKDLVMVSGLNLGTISDLLNDKQKITDDIVIVLSKVFGQSTQYWLNLDNKT